MLRLRWSYCPEEWCIVLDRNRSEITVNDRMKRKIVQSENMWWKMHKQLTCVMNTHAYMNLPALATEILLFFSLHDECTITFVKERLPRGFSCRNGFWNGFWSTPGWISVRKELRQALLHKYGGSFCQASFAPMGMRTMIQQHLCSTWTRRPASEVPAIWSR